jgi:Ran GTPase-activating protein (RanGAP) involved in mRNA processing and transport
MIQSKNKLFLLFFALLIAFRCFASDHEFISCFESKYFEKKYLSIGKKLSKEDMLFFVDTLKKDKFCTDLQFSPGTLASQNIGILVDALKITEHVTGVALSHNSLSAEAEKIANLLKHNNTIQELELQDTGISPDELFVLAEALEVNKSLEKLNLRDNYIGSRINFARLKKKNALARFAEALKKNQALKDLNLSKCNLNEEDALLIVSALRDNTNIKNLDISGNLLMPKAIIAILDALHANQSLISISLDINYRKENIEAVIYAVLELLKINTRIFISVGATSHSEIPDLKKLLSIINTKYSNRVNSSPGLSWIIN